MVLALALLIDAAFVAAAVGAMLLVRRRAPVGGSFADSDRAAGVFGVMGTGFAVLIGFVILLAFGSYERAGDGASREAVAVSQMFSTASVFGSSGRRLRGELACYGRAVVNLEWPAMRDERSSPVVARWVLRLDDTLDRLAPVDARARAAYTHVLEEASQRTDGRRTRLGEATPYVPRPVWVLLIAGAVLIVVFMLFNADPAERWLAQMIMMGAIAASVASGMVIVWLLDHPYERVSGSIQPTAMHESLARMRGVVPPCDARGK